jgi:3D (Asp-Asp-Asp) domain-containing protein
VVNRRYVASGLQADPTIVRIYSATGRRHGTYAVADTGGGVRGLKLDIFMPSCRAARTFGVRRVRVAVLRRGWGPEATVAKR